MKSHKVMRRIGNIGLSIAIVVAAANAAYAYRDSAVLRESIAMVSDREAKIQVSRSAGDNTPQCPESFVDPASEGPYYKSGSPERSNLIEEGVEGVPITLSGYVFDKDCNPVPGAWLDFWQADGNGNYDNRGYRLRGHQFTDERGKYLLRTVMAREYAGRTSHIHVKVAGQKGGIITTSHLYFPERGQNAADPFFSDSMVIVLNKGEDGENLGYFNFRLNQ